MKINSIRLLTRRGSVGRERLIPRRVAATSARPAAPGRRPRSRPRPEDPSGPSASRIEGFVLEDVQGEHEGAFRLNMAVQVTGAAGIVNVDAHTELPDHDMNVEPGLAVAVSATSCPAM